MQNKLAILKLGILLFIGLFLATNGPTFAAISPTQFVPGDTAVALAADDQVSPAIAHGNGQSLVVWADRRALAAGAPFTEFETASDIYGMFLDASGNPQSALPFPIAQAKGSQTTPNVFWNGTNWLVVFRTSTLSGTGFFYDTALAAVRISAAGQLLDETPIILYNTAGSYWDIASDGTDWFIAYEDGDIFAVKLTGDGQLQQPGTILVPQTFYTRSNLDLACTGGVCLLTFTDQGTTGAVRFDSNVNVLGGGMFTLLDGAFVSDLAANGTEFYAVWTDQLPDFTIASFGSRLDTNANLLDGTNTMIANQNGANAPAVGWDGTNWLAAWNFVFDLYTARISAAGQVLDPGGVLVSNLTLDSISLGATAVTSNGSLQMVRSEFANNEYDVFTVNIPVSNVAGPLVPVSMSAPTQVFADSAVGSNGYMMSYRSDTGSAYRLMAQPLDASGTPLTSEPIMLASGDYLTGPGTPSVAWNGSNYVITWGQDGIIYAQRLQQNGTLIDANPITVMAGFGATDVSAIGSTYLIVGRQFGLTTQIINVYVARLDGNTGAVLDTPPMLAGFNHARSVALTTMGNRWFLAYQRNFTHDDPLAETNGVFIEANGSVGTEFQVYGFYSVNGGNSMFQVATAASDTTALVIQSAEISSGVETDLVGVIVNSDGTKQPAQNLTPWQGNQYRPHLAWDGTQFVLAYNEQRNRFAPLTLDQLDARSDLYGMRISESGTVLDPQGFIFSNSALSEANPHVSAANGVSLFAGSIFQNSRTAYGIGYQQFGVGGNQWPVAVAGADVLGGDVPFTVNFNSTGSTDLDGTIVSYAWDFGDGSTSTAANPSHGYTAAGDYVATLTVTDNQGATTSNAVAIAAQAPNIDPVAFIAADVTSGNAPLSVVFTAAGSYDPDGSIGNIEWDFGDNSFNYFGSPAFHTFSAEGVYTVTVTVYDGRGGSGTASMVINVGPEPPNQPPIAVAGVNVTSGDVPFNPFFNSFSSSDPDGSIVGWLWDFGDGTTSNVPHPAIKIYETPGTYTVTLTVTDNDGATDSDSLVVTATGTAGNQPPTAVLGVFDTTGPAPFTPSFSSSGSSDVDGFIVSYLWDFGDGTTSTLPNPGFGKTYTVPGTYLVTLTVTDDDGLTGSDSVTITVTGGGGGNQPPVAVISATPTSGPSPLTVLFNSDGSSDPDGSIVSYLWEVSDGRSTTRQNPRLRFNSDGVYTVTLTVTDDQGATGTATVTITVGDAPVNQPPTAVASADVTSGDAPLSVNFTGSGSSDSDGTIASYAWDFGDGGSATTANPNYSYTTAGIYVATLTVTDNEGATDTDAVTITVIDPAVNQPPTAVASADVTTGEAPLMVFFNGSSSTDADGMIISYAWDFGDGNSTTGATAFNTYTAAGTYVATLTVTDNEGATATDTVTITVTEPGNGCSSNCAIVSNISLTVRNNGSLVAMVTVVDENGSTLTGATVDVLWTLPNGTTSADSTAVSSRGTARFNLGDNGPGTYTLAITNVTFNGYTFDVDNSVLVSSVVK
ncbi:MAG: PKD domain-containing protein [Ardenticatenaceae bacterium]|nr:PKD domain-containing protein [Ardenticatenaceae bacterium]